MGIIYYKNDSKYDIMTEIKKGSVEGHFLKSVSTFKILYRDNQY